VHAYAFHAARHVRSGAMKAHGRSSLLYTASLQGFNEPADDGVTAAHALPPPRDRHATGSTLMNHA
jgi:hypothetical protein